MSLASSSPRIGYVPYASDFGMPGDRRRFVHYARQRGLAFEIARPDRTYDVVVLSERADISVWSRYRHGKVVYDLIDSYLAIPRSDPRGRLRGLAKFLTGQSRHPQFDYWKAVERMCRRADAVVCTTEEQRRDIEPFCANVHIILDVHSSVVRTVKQSYVASDPFRLVWEGMPYTVHTLRAVAPVLQSLARERPLELHLVTDLEYYRYMGRYGRTRTLDEARRLFPDVHLHEWREEAVADIVCAADLAVIPLPLDDRFAAGKPENKLLLFWRMAMPALVSASPAYARAVAAAQGGLACTSAEDWERGLRHFMDSEEARRDAGERGFRYASGKLSEEAILECWDRLFQTL